MQLITNEIPHKIIASEEKHIKLKNDIHEEAHYEDGELIEEHFPYYTTTIFVPDTFTIDDMNEQYIEEDIEN